MADVWMGMAGQEGFLHSSVGIAVSPLMIRPISCWSSMQGFHPLRSQQEQRMTGSIASGLEAAGSNEGGAMLGFAGMTMR